MIRCSSSAQLGSGEEEMSLPTSPSLMVCDNYGRTRDHDVVVVAPGAAQSRRRPLRRCGRKEPIDEGMLLPNDQADIITPACGRNSNNDTIIVATFLPQSRALTHTTPWPISFSRGRRVICEGHSPHS
jgi:hypothetical protein